MGMQECFDSQIKKDIAANDELQVCNNVFDPIFILVVFHVGHCIQEQLHKRDTTIMELQRNLDDKYKELHAIRLHHEAVCALV